MQTTMPTCFEEALDALEAAVVEYMAAKRNMTEQEFRTHITPTKAQPLTGQRLLDLESYNRKMAREVAGMGKHGFTARAFNVKVRLMRANNWRYSMDAGPQRPSESPDAARMWPQVLLGDNGAVGEA